MAALPPGIRERRVAANGLEFRVLEAGPEDAEEFALCLHGFPECAHSWLGQLPLLAGLGFRVQAPDLRGYGESDRPRERSAYAIEELVADVEGWIGAAGVRGRTTLVAHDWGAIIAWVYASRHPDSLRRLVTMNVPHPMCFREQAGFRQFLRSWYALLFQVPGLVERILGRDGEWVRRALTRTSAKEGAGVDDAVVDACVKSAAGEGAVTAMVAYYRELLSGGGARRMMTHGFEPVPMPVLSIWGEQDVALTKRVSFGQQRYAPRLVQRYLPHASHWVQHDDPKLVNAMLEAFLKGESVPHAEGASGDIG